MRTAAHVDTAFAATATLNKKLVINLQKKVITKFQKRKVY